MCDYKAINVGEVSGLVSVEARSGFTVDAQTHISALIPGIQASLEQLQTTVQAFEDFAISQVEDGLTLQVTLASLPGDVAEQRLAEVMDRVKSAIKAQEESAKVLRGVTALTLT